MNNHQTSFKDNRDFFFEALLANEYPQSRFKAEDSKKIKAIEIATKTSLDPYLKFLNNSINALSKRSDYACLFQKLNDNDSFALNLKFRRYSINKKNTLSASIKLEDSSYLKQDKKNRLLFIESDEEIAFYKKDARFSPDGRSILSINDSKWYEEISKAKSDTKVELNGKEVLFEKKEIIFHQGDKFTQNGNQFTIYSVCNKNDEIVIELEESKISLSPKNPISYQGTEISLSSIRTIPKQLFFADNGKEWKFRLEGDEYLSVNSNETFKCPIEMKDENGFIYILREYVNSKHGRNSISIRLNEDENIEEGKKSSRDYFFENESLKEIYQGEKANKFKVYSANPDEQKLRIANKSEKGKDLDLSLPIKMVIDTTNLKRQRKAINTLLNCPMKEHRNLIKLFERKDLAEKHNLWKTSKQETIKNWFVLKNELYEGTKSQRCFVEKSLATDDFMLLEGPPGSGKTTAILELILQLVNQGKRILLTASTHVAIDNILDRVIKFEQVSPLRIGREDSFGETVKKFSLESRKKNLIEAGWENNAAERFLLDSSNLVCGTTMGIQNHPDFSHYTKQEYSAKTWNVVPFYDVMIIDEASKTTFQEFLVPALYAKKWIIVGDIQQLAPYSETEYLKAHLKESIASEIQRLSVLNFKLSSLQHPPKKDFSDSQNLFPLALELPEEISIKNFKESIYNRIKNELPNGNIAYANSDKNFFNMKNDQLCNWIDLYKNFNLLIMNANSLKELDNFIPESFHRISLCNNKSSEAIRRRESLLYGKDFLKKTEELFFFFNKNWVDEISWRLVRKFERRHLTKESIYEKDLKKLVLNDDQNTANILDDIEHIFFPSILELLQKGNEKDNRYETTLTKGFNSFANLEIFENRFERLDYQHRMHPEISKFSREHFYGKERNINELQDGLDVNREWNYQHYPSHEIWLNVKRNEKYEKGNKRPNKNYTEQHYILEETKTFINWAKNHPQQSGPWTVAILTYYKPQEEIIRTALQNYTETRNSYSHFEKDGVKILLYTVDKFQGREADIVFLSMCRDKGIGFMDNINRLNVALTRAKFQRVIVGDQQHFRFQKSSQELSTLATESTIQNINGEFNEN